jgi:hypothetical protein
MWLLDYIIYYFENIVLKIGYLVKIMVFYDVTPCSLVDRYQYSRGTCCLHHHPPWRWRQQILPKCWYLSTQQHSVISQKTWECQSSYQCSAISGKASNAYSSVIVSMKYGNIYWTLIMKWLGIFLHRHSFLSTAVSFNLLVQVIYW